MKGTKQNRNTSHNIENQFASRNYMLSTCDCNGQTRLNREKNLGLEWLKWKLINQKSDREKERERERFEAEERKNGANKTLNQISLCVTFAMLQYFQSHSTHRTACDAAGFNSIRLYSHKTHCRDRVCVCIIFIFFALFIYALKKRIVAGTETLRFKRQCHFKSAPPNVYLLSNCIFIVEPVLIDREIESVRIQVEINQLNIFIIMRPHLSVLRTPRKVCGVENTRNSILSSTNLERTTNHSQLITKIWCAKSVLFQAFDSTIISSLNLKWK